MIIRSEAESEDCLYLSIWTPATAETERHRDRHLLLDAVETRRRGN
jgi:hypothetical protein